MSKATIIAVTEVSMAALRQLKGDRKEYAEIMLPQRLEDNKLINFKDQVIGTWDGEDQEIYPLEYMKQKMVTDAWLNKLFAPINGFLGTASEREEEDDEFEETPEPIEEIETDYDPINIEELIKKGKFKKAKKLLKEDKELIDDAEYKTLMKQIKKGMK